MIYPSDLHGFTIEAKTLTPILEEEGWIVIQHKFDFNCIIKLKQKIINTNQEIQECFFRVVNDGDELVVVIFAKSEEDIMKIRLLMD